MQEPLFTFWKTTWNAWRSNNLAVLSPAYAKIAEGDLDHFVQASSYSRDSFLARLLESQSLLLGEFLIASSNDKSRTTLLLTNFRVVLFDLQDSQHVALMLSDIKRFTSSPNWSSHRASIELKDGRELSYAKLAMAPSDSALSFALGLAATDSCTPASTQNSSLPIRESDSEERAIVSVESADTSLDWLRDGIGIGALLGAGAGAASHLLDNGRLSLLVWSVSFIVMTISARNKLFATASFGVVGGLTAAILPSLDRLF